jgi:hypothetical protein
VFVFYVRFSVILVFLSIYVIDKWNFVYSMYWFNVQHQYIFNFRVYSLCMLVYLKFWQGTPSEKILPFKALSSLDGHGRIYSKGFKNFNLILLDLSCYQCSEKLCYTLSLTKCLKITKTSSLNKTASIQIKNYTKKKSYSISTSLNHHHKHYHIPLYPLTLFCCLMFCN